jgi:hypothetical protein
MKYIPLTILLLAVIFSSVPASQVFAKSNHSNDDSYEDHDYEDYDDESDEESDDDTNRDTDDNKDRDDDSTHTLEIEADVFTDTTIVTVEETNGKKTIFSTDADTKIEVINAIMSRFDFDRDEIEAVLDFEIEDRASRADDRKGLNSNGNNHNGTTTPTINNKNLSELQAKISELQKILNILIELLRTTSN